MRIAMVCHRWSALIATVLFCMLARCVAECQTIPLREAEVGARVIDQSLLKRPTIPVALVTVNKVEKNVDRTTAILQAVEALRGTFPADTFRVTLMYDDSSGLPTKVEGLSKSKPGDVWLAFFSPTSKGPYFLLEVHASSEELLSFVRANLAPPDRSAAIQLPILLIILAFSFFSKVLRRRGKSVVAAAVLVQLGLYAFYESGISIYTNIRIDLVLVYPAIVWNIVIASRSIALKSKTNDSSV